jgi:ATP-dependent protease ClpP protease subunit
MDRDNFLTAQESVNYGLADKIVESRELPGD